MCVVVLIQPSNILVDKIKIFIFIIYKGNTISVWWIPPVCPTSEPIFKEQILSFLSCILLLAFNCVPVSFCVYSSVQEPK